MNSPVHVKRRVLTEGGLSSVQVQYTVYKNLPESLGFDVLLFVNNRQLYVFNTDLCDNFDFHLPEKIDIQKKCKGFPTEAIVSDLP